MCCCAFRSLVGALLKGGASALWVVAHLVLCHMHYLQHQIWGSNLKERAEFLGAWLGEGRERRRGQTW